MEDLKLGYNEKKVKNRMSRQRKNKFSLNMNIEDILKEFSLDRIGFFTVTFGDFWNFKTESHMRVTQKIFRKMTIKIFPLIFHKWLRVIEPQESGRIHYHLIVVLKEPLFKDFDWNCINTQDYKNVNPELRKVWNYIREKQKKFKYGRCELLPIKSINYVGQYLSNYMTKIDNCNLDFKFRRIQYSRNFKKKFNSNFTWVNDGGARACVKKFMDSCGITEWDQAEKKFGHIKNWYLQILKGQVGLKYE